jgi:hypothetical protein
MPVTINGTTGVIGPDGSASTPSYQGSDSNTGIFFPAADTIAFAEGGAEVARFDSSGNLGLGTSSPAARLHATKNAADVARFTNSLSNGGDWEFKIGGGGFEDRRLMITDKFGGADNVRVGIDSSGNFQMNSGYGSAAVAYGCRAWVNFNGTGTVAIRASGNVSSITDNGTGDYTVNFTTAMPDGNYSIVGSTIGSGNGGTYIDSRGVSLATGSARFGAFSSIANTLGDRDFISIAVFR